MGNALNFCTGVEK